jgi:hypothetical protein
VVLTPRLLPVVTRKSVVWVGVTAFRAEPVHVLGVMQNMENGVLHGRFVVQVDEIFNAGASQAQRCASSTRLLGSASACLPAACATARRSYHRAPTSGIDCAGGGR